MSNRREFMRITGSLLGASLLGGRRADALGESLRGPQRTLSAEPFSAPPLAEVRIGMVGVGLQGTSHIENLLRVPGARVTAVCDIVEEKVQRARKMVADAGQPEPAGFSRGPRDFERLCQANDVDLVFTSTPWEWHVPVCLAAMKNGKHAATEVPAAMSLDECWALVEAAEKHRRHCVMMENCNYGRSELMVLNMARQGLFGEILHAEGGYLHDLRGVKFENANEGLWRRAWSMKKNANLYPTHGLGPVANCMDINRGDRFDYLVSMSSPSRGLQLFAQANFPEGAPQRAERYVLGDVNTSMIRTARGRSILVVHDTNLPRPYSRINLVQGTRGLFQGYPDRVHIEGRSPEHTWEDAKTYLTEFDHPFWKKLERDAAGAGHGGMDYLEDYRLIECLREGTPTDMDVYDAAALSAVVELSERSVARRSEPVEFPDFTRGRWKARPAGGYT
ncbi:MAG TPA: Gfo/Idh/MocA family oxidoreductase [Vicinamibacterales bacterium]|nr:Gfo/Idh/MocA family oxidoreductase [Vicinamibacterales bacterium]